MNISCDDPKPTPFLTFNRLNSFLFLTFNYFKIVSFKISSLITSKCLKFLHICSCFHHLWNLVKCMVWIVDSLFLFFDLILKASTINVKCWRKVNFKFVMGRPKIGKTGSGPSNALRRIENDTKWTRIRNVWDIVPHWSLGLSLVGLLIVVQCHNHTLSRQLSVRVWLYDTYFCPW